jgi:hypothetical protein
METLIPMEDGQMRTSLTAFTAMAITALGLAACGGGGGDGKTDGTSGVDGYPAGMPTIPAGDYVWSGCEDLPPPGSPTDEMVSATFVVEDFEQGYVVEGVQLEVFYGNSTDGDPDLDDSNLDVTDVDGRVTALVPADRLIAYRVVGGPTPNYPPGEVKTSIEYDVTTPAADGGTIDAISVSQATYMLISTVLGITPSPTLGILAGGFDDCDGQNVEGVVARLHAGGTCCGTETRCLDRYFIDETPAQDQWWSSADGLFGVLQVPPADDYLLELHGIVSGSGCPGEMAVVGRHDNIRVIADAITILDFKSIDTADEPWTSRCVW